MLYWWSILVTLCLNLLVSAVNFHGVGDVSVGDNVSLGLEMGEDDNFHPFDLVLQSTASDGAQTMLQHIANVSLTFTVSISVPQMPDGFYIYCASEPDSDHTFSRSNRFLITNNATEKSTNNPSPPHPIVSPVTSTIPNPTSSTGTPHISPAPSSSLLPGAPRMDIQKEIDTIKAENTRLLIIISAISAALGLGLVAALVIYLRLRERRWLEMASPIQFEPRRESVVRLGAPRIPEPKFSAALSDSLAQAHSDSSPRSRSMSAHDHVRMASVQVTTGGGTRSEDPPPVYV